MARKVKRLDLSGKNIDVKECPCCGSEDLRVGVMSSQSFGVVCQNCHLSMSEYVPAKGWPRGVWIEGKTVDHNYRRLEVWTCLRAVKRWNRRPSQRKKP